MKIKTDRLWNLFAVRGACDCIEVSEKHRGSEGRTAATVIPLEAIPALVSYLVKYYKQKTGKDL